MVSEKIVYNFGVEFFKFSKVIFGFKSTVVNKLWYNPII